MQQRIRFCPGGNGRPIAYAAAGEGTPVICPAWWVSHLEHDWANPRFRDFLGAVARRHALIRYDRAGVGLSDRTRTTFSLEAELADFEAVVATTGERRFAVFAQSAGAPVAVAFAAAHPDRVTRLVLYGSYARGSLLAPPEVRDAMPSLVRASWGLGSEILADVFAPGCSPEELEQLASFQRVACSAEMASRLLAYGIEVAEQARRITNEPRAASFVRRGEVWEVTFGGRTVHLKHGKGLADLACLLGRAGTDVPAAELAYAGAPDWVSGAPSSPVLDARTLARCRDRLAEIDGELERAEAWHDVGRRERLLADRELLAEELRRVTRPGGRWRTFPDERERARKAVSARIRQSITALRSVHPELGEHLERSVTTGSRCRYAPHPPVSWRT